MPDLEMPTHLWRLMALSPAALETCRVLEDIAQRIILDHAPCDVVEMDMLLNAAIIAHSVHRATHLGIQKALEAHGLPPEAAPIAALMARLSFKQAEAVRLMVRATAWHDAFGDRAGLAPPASAAH
jgi:hypothetical protein